MRRRLFTIAAALSCLLAVGVAASWVRSYWAYDQVSCGSTSDRYRCAVLTSFGKVSLRQAVYSEEPLPGTGAHGYGRSSDDNAIPSFSYLYAVTGDMSGKGHWTVRQATVRHWALALLFALLPAAWLLARRRPKKGKA